MYKRTKIISSRIKKYNPRKKKQIIDNEKQRSKKTKKSKKSKKIINNIQNNAHNIHDKYNKHGKHETQNTPKTQAGGNNSKIGRAHV